MKFTVCIPTVRPTTLAYTVQSIIDQTWTDWELLLVGQGNDPDLKHVGDRLQSSDSRIRYLHLDQRGIARARNAGLRAATGDIIAMTDDDCEAAPDWLETLAAEFQRSPEVGVVGGALVAPKTSRWKLETCLSFVPTQSLYDPTQMSTPPAGWGWIGANFALRATIVQRVGEFDECLGVGAPMFPAAEEVDYSRRVIAAGIASLSCPRAVVFHTYGVRRGIKQNLRLARAYARGNAGLDAKLTLAGDPHGQASAASVLRQGLRHAIRTRKIQRIPVTLLYDAYYQAAYRQGLRDFTLGGDGRLQPISAAQVTSAQVTSEN